MLGDLRRGMIPRDEDEREGLVIPHQHIVARLQLLDEIGFKQQRFGFRRGRDEFHLRRFGDHPRDTVVRRVPARIGTDTRLEVARLADIEHLTCGIDHAINTGRAGQGLPESADHRHAGRQPLRQIGEIEHHLGGRIIRPFGGKALLVALEIIIKVGIIGIRGERGTASHRMTDKRSE